MNPYIPVAPHGIDPSLAVGITNPGGPNPMEGNVLLCSVSPANQLQCLLYLLLQIRRNHSCSVLYYVAGFAHLSTVWQICIFALIIMALHIHSMTFLHSSLGNVSSSDSDCDHADREPGLPRECGSTPYSLHAIWLCPEDRML